MSELSVEKEKRLLFGGKHWVEKEKRLLFGGKHWIWQADGSPFGDPVHKRDIKLTRFC